jgi:hypothetical protein
MSLEDCQLYAVKVGPGREAASQLPVRVRRPMRCALGQLADRACAQVVAPSTQPSHRPSSPDPTCLPPLLPPTKHAPFIDSPSQDPPYRPNPTSSWLPFFLGRPHIVACPPTLSKPADCEERRGVAAGQGLTQRTGWAAPPAGGFGPRGGCDALCGPPQCGGPAGGGCCCGCAAPLRSGLAGGASCSTGGFPRPPILCWC